MFFPPRFLEWDFLIAPSPDHGLLVHLYLLEPIKDSLDLFAIYYGNLVDFQISDVKFCFDLLGSIYDPWIEMRLSLAFSKTSRIPVPMRFKLFYLLLPL